ncbi:MAG: hypothetical protein G01um10143_417 [Parcubacteria group bacterium Gr01-1014_3]|nr:MAG: hypothetical protein G01um10143_417 [Parcubacteria group bacterium Gr01-1014_3]
MTNLDLDLAKTISAVSKKELGLLYYFPEEIERALKENRAVIIEENGRLVGWGFWTIRNGPPRRASWLEVHTLYIYPEFRGRGYLNKFFDMAYQRLKDANLRAYFFTRAGAVMHMAEKYGFKKASVSDIPISVWIKMLLHRLNPRRLSSYLKYGWRILGAWKWDVYIR